MNYNNLEKFIQDLGRKERSKNTLLAFFIRGSIKMGLNLGLKNYAAHDTYYFNLDEEDIQYLKNKYTPIYERMKEEEKIKEIQSKKELIKKLTKEIQDEL